MTVIFYIFIAIQSIIAFYLLQVLYQSLKNDGVLIVTVPNGKGPREVFVTKPTQNLRRKNNWMWRLIKSIKRIFGYGGTTVQSSADDLTHIQFFTKKIPRTTCE